MASNTLSLSISFSASSPHLTPYPTKLLRTIPSPSLSFPFRNHAVLNSLQQRHVSVEKKQQLLGLARSVEEETQIIPEEQQETSSSSPDQPAVSVPVSPSDILTMFFQAEGVMNEAIIPNLTRALEETEGISNLKVQVLEGIASVELTKQTTVQATGVASSLLETIQGGGWINFIFDKSSEETFQHSCILLFDGASKGNPGLAGAGAVLRAEDGSMVCRLREGVGFATNNVAEYQAVILGLRHAVKKGYKHIRVQGDSKLVCMQIQGVWKTKNQNMADLCKVAKDLKDKFVSFQINHVLREFNSEADAQANLAINLKDGQVEEDCRKQ